MNPYVISFSHPFRKGCRDRVRGGEGEDVLGLGELLDVTWGMGGGRAVAATQEREPHGQGWAGMGREEPGWTPAGHSSGQVSGGLK